MIHYKLLYIYKQLVQYYLLMESSLLNNGCMMLLIYKIVIKNQLELIYLINRWFKKMAQLLPMINNINTCMDNVQFALKKNNNISLKQFVNIECAEIAFKR